MIPTDTPIPPANAKPSRPKQRITPRALLEVKRPSDPRIHPDGQRVAFVVTEADFEESRWVSHLWLTEYAPPDAQNEAEETAPVPETTAVADTQTQELDEAGGTDDNHEAEDYTRQLTFSHEGETHPRWSPDGHYLAFLSARYDPTETEHNDEDDEEEPKEQLWILPGDGGEARKVTSAKEGVLDFEWTPDGKAIIYLAPEPRPRPIESVRKEERNRRKIDPIVEHDDRLRRQFWRVDVEERKPKLLFTADYGVTEFALSPDGERLCFATNYTGDWNDYHKVDLYVRHLKDGVTYKLIERAGGKANVRWSPNGYQIAFLSWLDPELSYSRESLFVAGAPLDAPGGTPLEYGPQAPGITTCRLLSALDYDFTEFVWSRPDDAIYAVAAVHTGNELYSVHPSGETTRLEMGGAAERENLAIDPEGTVIAYVQESETALPEIFLGDASGEIHCLTKLNVEFAETYRLPRQEVVSWPSPDGLLIEGVLTYPLDYEAGTRAPLIVQIHGGPKGCATNSLRSYGMPPVWSAEGYAVLQPNFRGSSGYGNVFAIANRRDLGGGDFTDIMAGIDDLIAKGIADPDRLGVMGGSYGGYMTNWAIGHTDRFRAAVSMFGIFHLQTDYSNSELSRWDNDYLGAYYWEDPEIYRRLSPGSYIENIKTPTLILHGDDDNNTFISNSKELYQALRHRGVTTQFVHYPREGHGLREPNHKLDEVRRSLAWMDRYVRHGGQNPGVYRLGDKIPNADGLLELCVIRAEITAFLGQPAPPPGSEEIPAALLEVAFTLHNRDTRLPIAPLTLALADVRLEETEGEKGRKGERVKGEMPHATMADAPSPLHPLTPSPLHPVGVPLDSPGGKVLIEGDNLRLVQHPDKETGQLAFACAVVFRVPKAGGERLLRIADFAPIALTWEAEEEGAAEKDEGA